MTVKKIILLFLIVSCLAGFTSRLQAQGGALAVTDIYNFPPLILEGLPYDSIIVIVENTDTMTYQGSMSLWMLADSSNNPMMLSSGSPTLLLAPGDTAAITINNYFFDPAGFKEGQNIVVVWPIGNVTTDVDSFYTSTYYVHATSVEDLLSEKDLSVSPVPAQDHLFVNYDPAISLEQVRILDMKGRLVDQFAFNSRQINISGYSKGIYYLYFYHRNGVSIRKFIKE